tara:strand:+ start:247 stop:1830 length:1584 start_codon:yes stop_codon:yes gene_type:complete
MATPRRYPSGGWTPRKSTKASSKRKVRKTVPSVLKTVSNHLENGGKLKDASKLKVADISSILMHREQKGKLNDLFHYPSMQKLTDQIIAKVHGDLLPVAPRVIPWVAASIHYMNSEHSGTDKVPNGVDTSKIEEYVAPTIQRTGQYGVKKPYMVKFSDGPQSQQLKEAIRENGRKTDKDIHVTSAASRTDLYYSQAGINRRGWYLPWARALQPASGYGSDSSIYLDQMGLINGGFLKTYSDEKCVSQPTLDYLQDADSRIDIRFPFLNVKAIHHIQNEMEYTPVDVTVYILRCRRNFVGHPGSVIWKNWNTGPLFDSDYAPVLQGLTEELVYTVDTANVTDGTGTSTINQESSSVLGITPYWSPTFLRNWNIVKVIKDRLQPNDIMELHLEREYKDAISYRYLESQDINTSSGNPTYIPGDYEILISFAGAEGTCQGATPSTDSNINVAALRSRISKRVEHSVSFAWESITATDPTAASAAPYELFRKGWMFASQRTVVPEERNAKFSDGYAAVVMSNADVKVGDAL